MTSEKGHGMGTLYEEGRGGRRRERMGTSWQGAVGEGPMQETECLIVLRTTEQPLASGVCKVHWGSGSGFIIYRV